MNTQSRRPVGPKLLRVLPDPDRPWMVGLRFGFHEGLKNWVKGIPGGRWDNDRKVWWFPVEMLPALSAVAPSFGYRIDPFTLAPDADLSSVVSLADALQRLYPFQSVTAVRAAQRYAHLFNFEMGLGKTPTTIAAMRLRGVKSALIVSPAMARRVWVDALNEWWTDHPSTHSVRPARKVYQSDFVIVSYNMLGKVLDNVGTYLTHPPEALIFDEIHYVQNPETRFYQNAALAVQMFPRAWRAGLTGTAITNEVTSLWGPLDILYPGRFGSKFQFSQRYSIGEHNGYGWKFKGLNEDNVEELRQRLVVTSTRKHKGEPDVQEALRGLRMIPQLVFFEGDRIATAVEKTEDLFEQGAKHVNVLTHLRESAHEIARKFSIKGVATYVITGDMSAEDRADVIDKAKSQERSLVCATLHSVAVAIDLTYADNVLFAELSDRPADMVQVLGRYDRLSSTHTILVWIMANEDGDSSADNLFHKVKDMNQVLPAGRAEDGLQAALKELRTAGMTPEKLNEMMRNAALEFNDDYFG